MGSYKNSQKWNKTRKPKKPHQKTQNLKTFFEVGEFSFKSGFYNLHYESCKLSENKTPLFHNAAENFL